jgi:vacuolar-type H+-ATPase subunit H
MFNKTKQLHTWLQGRGWFAKDMGYIMERYERDIEKARIEAATSMIARLIRYENEAKMHSVNTEYTARERQQSRTELNKISSEIERLISTLDEKYVCSSWKFRFGKQSVKSRF